jgi:citrate synthase
MMTENTWNTAITEILPNEVRLRGYRIDKLMSEITFSQAIFLALRGELPSPEVARLIDAILISSIDHGATPPSALAARTAASTGAPLNAAVAAGILSINRFHGAAIYDCMGVILEGLQRARANQENLQKTAIELVAEYKEAKKRIAGLGHRIHKDDPRTKRLFNIAREVGVAGDGVEMIREIQKAMQAGGKDLPINVDGAIAALLVDMGVPRDLGNAFFIMARLPGLVAHTFEEISRERPMRRIDPQDHAYDGPHPRSL